MLVDKRLFIDGCGPYIWHFFIPWVPLCLWKCSHCSEFTKFLYHETVYNPNNVQISGPFQFWIISPTVQSPCTTSPTESNQLLNPLLWEVQVAGPARVERPGHDPTTGALPCPSGLNNSLDCRLHQGWGLGGCKPLRTELSVNQEGKGVGSAESSQQEQAGQMRLLGQPLWLSKYWVASSPRWGLKWSCQARVNWRELQGLWGAEGACFVGLLP